MNYRDMRVKDLKTILEKLPDDMLIVLPVVDENDVNYIYAFRRVRTAGILNSGHVGQRDQNVLCLNGAAYGADISDQVHSSGCDVNVTDILYGSSNDKSVPDHVE